MGLIGALVAREDLGTAVSLMATGLIMAYLAGARKRHLAMLGLVCGVAFAAFVFHKEYRVQRVMAFMDPWHYYDGAGYQPAHSLVALGSGGLTGQGIARGDWDEIPVDLRFELGELRMPVGQLKAIQPGYVFELEAPAERPVTIRANRVRIAIGRLVRIGPRIGVQVMEVYGRADQPE